MDVAIKAKQLWKERTTGELAKVTSYLEKFDKVLYLPLRPGIGVQVIDGAAFRARYELATPPKTIRAKTVAKTKAPAKKPAARPKKKSPEKDLVKSILARLEVMPNVAAWRNNTGAFKVEAKGKTKRKFVRFGALGSGDVFVVVGPQGFFLSVEAKAGTTERPTQRAWRQQMARVGAASIVVHTVEEVVEAVLAIQRGSGFSAAARLRFAA